MWVEVGQRSVKL